MRLLALLLLAAAPAGASEALRSAHALYFEGRLPEALAAYQQAARATAPRAARAEALKNSAIVLRDLGRRRQAAAALRRARALAPRDAPLLEQSAWFEYLSGDLQAAAKTARAAVAAAPASPLARYALAAALGGLGRREEAERLMAELASDRRYFLPAHLELGALREARGDLGGAREAYERILKLDYTFVEPRLPLARVIERLGDADASQRQYLEVRKVDAAHPEVKRRMPELAARIAAAAAVRAKGFARAAAGKFQPGALPQAPRRESMPRLRVGLGGSASGRALPASDLLLTANGPFRLYAKDNGSPLARGGRHEAWRVEAASGPAPALILSAPGLKKTLRLSEPVFLDTDSSSHTFLLHNVRFGQGFSWAGAQDREYRGRIELIPDAQAGVVLVNEVPIEEYLYSALTSEMPAWSPLEALKSQAVIARTYALYRQKYGPHKAHPYDLCDTQHCQVYSGVVSERAKARRAVDETQGIVVTHRKRPIHGLYHANCGGHTQTAGDIHGWTGEPYLRAVAEQEAPPAYSPWELELRLKGAPRAYCAPSAHVHSLSYRWAWAVSRAELEERLSRKTPIGRLAAILPLRRNAAGYLLGARFKGISGEVALVKEHEIRRTLAIGQARSTQVLLDAKLDRNGRIERVYLFGGGWGHGVGLCQGGAANLASRGWAFDKILTHYYAGVAIESLGY